MTALLALLLIAPAADAQIFTKQQMAYLTADPNTDENVKECQEGASTKMQYFYHMLRSEGQIPVCEANSKPCACKPPWLEEMLPAMQRNAKWQDPNEGVLSEAALWQGPVSVLYEFFTILQKTFPPSEGVMGVAPNQLMREFADNSTRFSMSLDRVYKARLGGSMDGRGRAMLADLELIHHEYESLMDSLIRADIDQFKVSSMAIGDLCHMMFREVYRKPRGGEPPKSAPPSNAMTAILSGVSVFLVFLAGLQFGNLNRDQMSIWLEQYKVKAKDWTQEFNKQFVAVKVEYLVGGPWLGLTLFGMFTGSWALTFIFSGLGLYTGLNLPGFVIRNIRKARGAKVEVQLIDALTLLANALKSGLDLVGGFRLVQKELLPPISEEFGLVIKNFDLGTPFGRALEGMEDRIDSRLLGYMIKAIVIQQQVGGNIIKIFDRIVENIREESKLEEKVAAMTAQQRIQSIVVAMMPWIMMGIMWVSQPEKMNTFYSSPIGIIVLVWAIMWISIGMKVLSKLGDIKI